MISIVWYWFLLHLHEVLWIYIWKILFREAPAKQNTNNIYCFDKPDPHSPDDNLGLYLRLAPGVI